ncbi:class I SAM-dependent methyltransferase [Candidatus Hydrogenedentota bacterium]
MTKLSRLKEHVPNPLDAHEYGYAYLGKYFERISAYRHQAACAARTSPRSVLLIGKGDGLTIRFLEQAGFPVVCMDIEELMAPSVVASVHQIPFREGAFDVSVCCEVLEHLPWEDFHSSLRELRRVTRDALVLSVPDTRRCMTLHLKGPRISKWQLEFECQASFAARPNRPIPKGKLAKLGHYWEIGYEGVTKKVVKRALRSAGWKPTETWRPSHIEWPESFFYCRAAEEPPP